MKFKQEYAIITHGLAQIAQLVEQRTENPRVTGSIPVLGIYPKNFKKVLDIQTSIMYNTYCVARKTSAGVVQW